MAKSKRTTTTSKVTARTKKNNITNAPKYVTDAMPGKKKKR